MNPLHLTTWLSVLGCIPGRFGAWCWTTVGLGYLGICWERVSGSQIRPFREYKKDQLTLRGFVTHAPQLILGIYRLERGRKR